MCREVSQLACKANTGLFSKTAVMSAMIFDPYMRREVGRPELLKQAEKKGEDFFAYLGVKTLEEARAVDAVTLQRNYEKYMETVCDALLKDMPGPHAVFCHSMGGAVTGLFMEDHPGVFDRAVFCAPMIAPNRSGIPLFAGKLICRGAELLGHGSRRLFMSRPYDGPENFETSCASSRERFDWYDAVRVNTPAFHTNGPTYEWTKQSLSVTGWLLAPGAVEKITVPVRVYSAESDNSVLPEEQKRFAERLIRGKLIRVPGSRHEIYRSPDEVLFPWWHEILGFFGEAAG